MTGKREAEELLLIELRVLKQLLQQHALLVLPLSGLFPLFLPLLLQAG